MALAVFNSCALMGLSASLVRTEVHISAGLPSFQLVGLASTGVKESRDRVRAAISSSGYEFPMGRITVNLSPADLPKESGGYDLPIALGILMATGQLRLPKAALVEYLPHLYVVGELSLTGALLSVQAPLILALSIYQRDPKAILILPRADAAIVSLIEGLRVIGVETLTEAVDYIEGKRPLEFKVASQQFALSAVDSDEAEHQLCLSEIRGQAEACHLLELAASGGHHLLLSGPSGVGKTMLAERLVTLLPDLSELQRLELLAIQSVSVGGVLDLGTRPPLREVMGSVAVSESALLGGGSQAQPGEVSLAHHGILFLDDLGEFKRASLESLRGPMEAGEVTIARAHSHQVYPAQFQLVATANPCACGYLDHPEIDCICTHRAINLYQSKVSGALLERFDIHYKVPTLTVPWMEAEAADSSLTVRQRVQRCRDIQMQRQGVLNSKLQGRQIERYCALTRQQQEFLEVERRQRAWSTRVLHAVIKLARTSADMRGVAQIEDTDLELALTCRAPYSKKDEARQYWLKAKK